MENKYLLQRINQNQLLFMRIDNKPFEDLDYEYYDLYYNELVKDPYLTTAEIFWLMENSKINVLENNNKILITEANLVNRKVIADCKQNPIDTHYNIEYTIFRRGGNQISAKNVVGDVISQHEDFCGADSVKVTYGSGGRIVRIVFSMSRKRNRKILPSKQRKKLYKEDSNLEINY